MKKDSVIVPCLDGLRMLSILCTIALHTASVTQGYVDNESFQEGQKHPLFRYFKNGIFLMETFFVLSGFLITWNFLHSNIAINAFRYGSFIVSRLARLWPLLLLTCLLDCFFPVKGLDTGSWIGVWKPATFTLNISPFFPDILNQPHSFRLAWTWSVDVQMQFYLIAPLLMWLISVTNKKTIRLLLCAGLVFLALFIRYSIVTHLQLHHRMKFEEYNPQTDPVFTQYYIHVYQPLWSRFGSMAIGMLCALLLHDYGDGVKKIFNNRYFSYVALWFAINILGTMLLSRMDKTPPPEELLFGFTAGPTLFAIGVAIIMLSSLCYQEEESTWLSRVIYKVLNLQIWKILSPWSYAAYLIHIIVIGQVYEHLIDFPASTPFTVGKWIMLFSLNNMLVWPASYILYRFVEIPVFRWLVPTKLKEHKQ